MGVEEQTEYFCVFYKEPCPVRAMFKLKPESLVEFCKTCKISEKEKGLDIAQILHVSTNVLTGFFKAIGEREERYLQIIMKLIEENRTP